MIAFERQIEIQADVQTVWNVMIDVENWSKWTPSIRNIRKMNGSALKVGTKLLIEQPQLPEAVWLVAEVQRHKWFAMVKGNLLLTVRAGHLLEATAAGTRLTLSLEFRGLGARWVARKYEQMMNLYLLQEAEGMKAACEYALA
jgi:hypothetical protein